MPRDPRDKQQSGEHRADRKETSAPVEGKQGEAGVFNARAWLKEHYPDWTDDVKPYELELIETCFNSGRAAQAQSRASCGSSKDVLEGKQP